MTDVVYLLGFLLLFQSVFSFVVIHRLINKIMARDYVEYQGAKRLSKKPRIEKEYIQSEPQENLGRLLG